MNKREEYEKAIKDIAQIIALDREIDNAEAVALFGLMKHSGELAIKMISGNKHRGVKRLLAKQNS